MPKSYILCATSQFLNRVAIGLVFLPTVSSLTRKGTYSRLLMPHTPQRRPNQTCILLYVDQSDSSLYNGLTAMRLPTESGDHHPVLVGQKGSSSSSPHFATIFADGEQGNVRA